MVLHNNHICGCYFRPSRQHQRQYLPQVETKSHTVITPVSFTTDLHQTFHNPNPEHLPQVRYTFPLYDSVAVSGYTITFADKTLKGLVQQKDVAKRTYQDAVDRGETAGLLESLPAGVFGVTLGNVPPKTDILITIAYCGELRHDAAIDGLRYTLPTSICPRYGDYPGHLLQSNTAAVGGIQITVDVDMGKSAIRKVQSPSHPIAMSLGQLSTAAQGTEFSPAQASATLSQGSAELAGDFVLQLLIDDISTPQAIVEIHPDLPNQRAIMTTLVPKFVLDSAHPEVVFIADQSGSMSGSKNAALVTALKVFLKSLPLGVRFNICAFGNSFQFLWPKSQAYSEDNVATAISFVDTFQARYGGTELLQPIKESFERHLKDMPLELLILTDGEIWGEQHVFSLINEQIQDKQVDARVFALGIGQDVSHTLVEGVARAGRGFAQFITQNEDTDEKVIRMLKGALYAHTKDYELEVHYSDENAMLDDDDFEVVEKVRDCLVIEDSSQVTSEETGMTKSFFDPSADVDKPMDNEAEGMERYAHLPAIETPKVMAAPSEIPPLFPFNRTTLYLFLGPESSQKQVSSVTLRATSAQGPLELNVPIQGSQLGKSIHQLAASKATKDLEEGRGWLQAATVGTVLVKSKYPNRFDEIVEREVVRLGEKFQVATKFTSFVAVEDGLGKSSEDQGHDESELDAWSGGRPSAMRSSGRRARMRTSDDAQGMLFGNFSASTQPQAPSGGLFAGGSARQARGPSGSLFGGLHSNTGSQSGSLFGVARTSPESSDSLSVFGGQSYSGQGGYRGTLFGGQASGGSSFRAASQNAGTAPRRSRASHESVFGGGNVSSTSTGGLYGSSHSSAPRSGSRPASSFQATDSQATPPSLFVASVAEGSATDNANNVAKFLSSNSSVGAQADQGTGSTLRGVAAGTSSSPQGAFAVDAFDSKEEDEDESDQDMGFGLFDGPALPSKKKRSARFEQAAALVPTSPISSDDLSRYAQEMQQAACMPLPDHEDSDLSDSASKSKNSASTDTLPASIMHNLIGLQTFSGAWAWKEDLFKVLALDETNVDKSKLGDDADVAATALAIAFLQAEFRQKKDVWEMVVSKAKTWLTTQAGGIAKAEELIVAATEQLSKHA